MVGNDKQRGASRYVRRKDLKAYAADRSKQCQHVFEINAQPAKLMRVIHPDPWVCVMHDLRRLNVGVPNCLPLHCRSSNRTQPYQLGAKVQEGLG